MSTLKNEEKYYRVNCRLCLSASVLTTQLSVRKNWQLCFASCDWKMHKETKISDFDFNKRKQRGFLQSEFPKRLGKFPKMGLFLRWEFWKLQKKSTFSPTCPRWAKHRIMCMNNQADNWRFYTKRPTKTWPKKRLLTSFCFVCVFILVEVHVCKRLGREFKLRFHSILPILTRISKGRYSPAILAFDHLYFATRWSQENIVE